MGLALRWLKRHPKVRERLLEVLDHILRNKNGIIVHGSELGIVGGHSAAVLNDFPALSHSSLSMKALPRL